MLSFIIKDWATAVSEKSKFHINIIIIFMWDFEVFLDWNDCKNSLQSIYIIYFLAFLTHLIARV